LGKWNFPAPWSWFPARDGGASSLAVTPLHPSANPGGPLEPLAVIFIRAGDPAPLPLPELLRQAYGLTAAEARVLLAVVGGARLAHYAEGQAVSLETVRSQLKHVFAKTGCARQADLVRLVLNNPIFQLAGNAPGSRSW
jgi:DNA-binding CsgD family transcriptional regulator